jgi:hypothetical protein
VRKASGQQYSPDGVAHASSFSGCRQHAKHACEKAVLTEEPAMLIDTLQAHLQLERGQVSRLTGAAHSHLSSAAGTLWVTIDHDSRDIVLEAGQGFEVASRETLLVCALGGPAVLALRPAGAR